MAKTENKGHKSFAPLRVFKEEKGYFFWLLSFIVILLFGLIVINFKDAINTNQLIIFSTALLIPLSPDMLIGIVIDKKNERETKFLQYKIYTAISIVLLLIICLLAFTIGDKCTLLLKYFLHTIITISSIVASIYAYGVQKMETNACYFDYYDVETYKDKRDRELEELAKEAKQTDKSGDLIL